jgi:hypothetical protein
MFIHCTCSISETKVWIFCNLMLEIYITKLSNKFNLFSIWAQYNPYSTKSSVQTLLNLSKVAHYKKEKLVHNVKYKSYSGLRFRMKLFCFLTYVAYICESTVIMKKLIVRFWWISILGAPINIKKWFLESHPSTRVRAGMCVHARGHMKGLSVIGQCLLNLNIRAPVPFWWAPKDKMAIFSKTPLVILIKLR